MAAVWARSSAPSQAFWIWGSGVWCLVLCRVMNGVVVRVHVGWPELFLAVLGSVSLDTSRYVFVLACCS